MEVRKKVAGEWKCYSHEVVTYEDRMYEGRKGRKYWKCADYDMV